jgi:hypothetical protein
MDLSFLNNLRKIIDEDDRLVTITLLIDIMTNLINDRNNHRHHTLPVSYIQEMFQKYLGAMQCLNSIGFKKVRNLDFFSICSSASGNYGVEENDTCRTLHNTNEVIDAACSWSS